MSGFRKLFAVFLPFCLLPAGHGAFAQQGPASVAVSPIVERDLAAGQTFVSTIMPYKSATIGSAVDGRVADFPVNEGDAVKKGQPLAQLLTATIELELKAEEAELTFGKAELEELENGSRPEEIEQASAVMLAAKAAMDYQQTRRKRLNELFTRNAVNEDEMQLVVSQSVKAEQMFAEYRAAHKLAVDGPRPERIAQARARVAVQQARVDKLKDQIKKHTIVSPFDGFVVAEHTEVGQWVKQGELVAQVVALHEVEILAHVLENQVPHVKIGMSVHVEVPALPQQLFTGTVVRVVPQADLRSRTFPVKVRVENEISEDGPLLKSGMLARATLPTGAKRRALLVPKDALVLGGPSPVVYVVDTAQGNARTGKARPVPVRTGVADGRLIQVEGELSRGQLVVVRGNERLRPGQEVSVVEELKPDAEPRAKAVNSTRD
ncbi:MAG: efflux RND transporter periplasmic adaptor subunit [Planctomycetota bacterium]|nr:efflux RND transporter periplasmic adaptor subunit [Planctomycetota bacterium]MDA1251285.1 efflux RND transporter periplasmic adaptor subunit [Planctomycetota bacterium]